jgi:superfamily II DNA or RNA helicase
MTSSKMILINPAKILLPEMNEEVKKTLQYRDRSVEFQISKLKREARYRNSDWAARRVLQLKEEVIKSACWADNDGNWYTYSGLANILSQRFGWQLDSSAVEYPEPQLIPWERKPEHTPYPHQKEALEACIKHKHTGISAPTGSGKSFIIMLLLKHYGLKSVVMTPSKDITLQMYEELVYRFGKKYVGMFGGGKKESSKLFTIAVAQSLSNLEPGTKDYENISSAKVFISDESHTTPAETFDRVCMGPMQNAPYRFFFSATQMRNDGSDIILKGITGDVSYEISFAELVERGVLAKPICKIFSVPKGSLSSSTDPKTEMRMNLYENNMVNRLAADLANKSVGLGRPTVILIEEIKQFVQLYSYIKVPFAFCHGDKAGKHEDISFLPENIRIPDNKKSIDDFNSGKIKLIIGTSCITTGVDLKPTKTLINLQGGSSPIKYYQGLGRGTRVVNGKKDFWYIDFEIMGSATLERHCKLRAGFFEDLKVGNVSWVNKK